MNAYLDGLPGLATYLTPDTKDEEDSQAAYHHIISQSDTLRDLVGDHGIELVARAYEIGDGYMTDKERSEAAVRLSNDILRLVKFAIS